MREREKERGGSRNALGLGRIGKRGGVETEVSRNLEED